MRTIYKFMLYTALIFAFAMVCVPSTEVYADSKSEAEDWVKLVSVTPNHYDNYTDPVTFTATIQYSLQSKDKGIIYLGFNTEDAHHYTVDTGETAGQVVSKGTGTVVLSETVTPVNWNTGLSFMQQMLAGYSDLVKDFKIYANISEYPHEIPWTPLAIDEAVLTDLPEVADDSAQDEPIQDDSVDTDSITLFEDCGGNTNSQGIDDYLISEWKLKSPTFPVTLKKEPNDDGGYKIKATIGIGRKDILDQDSTWNQYKKCIKKLEKNVAKTSELTKFLETYGGKSKTFSVTEKMKAKPTLGFVGYYEIARDKNNNIISQEGGGTATASWKAKKSWQSVVMAGAVPIPLYFDLTGKIDLEGELGISFSSLDDRAVTGSLKLKPSVALGGGLGVSGVASVGVEGKLGLDAQLIPASKGSYKAGLALKAYIAFILDLTYQLPGAELEGTIWDTTKRSRSFEEFIGAEGSIGGREPSLSLVDRSYGEKTTEWHGSRKLQQRLRSLRASADASPVSVSSLQEYVMPNTIPLVQSVGGKTVMVFQSNDSERNTADSSCLMYSVFENGVWSQPKAVWDTGTCDLFADMKVINGTLYLVWQKEKSENSGSTDAADILDEMEKNSEICMAVFDAETGGFGQQQYITDDEETDMMPVLAESSSEVSVVWIRNTAGSFFGESGENRVMSVTRQGDSLTAPVQLGVTEDYVNELAAAYTGEELNTAIVTTKITRSEDSQGGTEAGIPCVSICTGNGQEVLSSASEYAGSVRFLDGKLYYLEDTFIYEFDPQTGETARISAGEVLSQEDAGGGDGEAIQTETTVFGSSYHIYSQNGKTAIIWNEATDTGSVLKSSVKTEDGFSAPVILFQTEDGKTIQNFDAILMADGDWQFAVNTRTAAEEKSAIEYVAKESAPKLKVDYMMAEEGERKNGIQPVHISVINESEETVTEYTIRIYTDETSYVEKTVECQILPGESVTFVEEVDLAGLDGQADLNVQVVADGQKEMDDTTASAPVGMTDLSLRLDKQTASEHKFVTFSALVKNESEVETAAHVALYEKHTGELIESREAGVLAPGAQKNLDFVLRADDVAIDGANAKYYEAVVVSSIEEYNQENNTGYGVVYADELGQDPATASPSVNPASTDKPDTPPTVTPAATTKPDTTPTATPSGKETMTPGTEHSPIPVSPLPGITPTEKPDTSPTATPGAIMKPTIPPTEMPAAGTILTPKPTTVPRTTAPLPSVSLPQLSAPVTQPPVLPAPADIGTISAVKLKQKKQVVTISWKKVSGAAGYQVCYSTSKKWKGKKQKLMRTNKLTVKKLKKKKTYYFRVRAYRINGIGKLYGAWSKTKKITIKK